MCMCTYARTCAHATSKGPCTGHRHWSHTYTCWMTYTDFLLCRLWNWLKIQSSRCCISADLGVMSSLFTLGCGRGNDSMLFFQAWHQICCIWSRDQCSWAVSTNQGVIKDCVRVHISMCVCCHTYPHNYVGVWARKSSTPSPKWSCPLFVCFEGGNRVNSVVHNVLVNLELMATCVYPLPQQIRSFLSTWVELCSTLYNMCLLYILLDFFK